MKKWMKIRCEWRNQNRHGRENTHTAMGPAENCFSVSSSIPRASIQVLGVPHRGVVEHLYYLSNFPCCQYPHSLYFSSNRKWGTIVGSRKCNTNNPNNWIINVVQICFRIRQYCVECFCYIIMSLLCLFPRIHVWKYVKWLRGFCTIVCYNYEY